MAAATAAAALLLRSWHVRSVLQSLDTRLSRGREGIVVGAEPIELEHVGATRAVLMIHGGADTPQTLGYLARAFHERGFAVRVPLLPGHGRSLRDFERVTAGDWTDAVLHAFDELAKHHESVSVVGLSMGGALTAQLAAARQSIPAIVLIAPYLSMPTKAAVMAATGPLWGPMVKYLRVADPRSIQDASERAKNRGYATFTAQALEALRETVRRAVQALPRIEAPTLVIQSRNDPRISVAACERTFALIGAKTKKLVLTDQGGHIVTVDYGRERVTALALEWIERFPPSGPSGSGSAA